MRASRGHRPSGAEDARRWGRSIAVAMAALCWAALAVPGARAASGPEYFGTNLQTLGAVTPSQRGAVVDRLGRGGLTLGRIEVRWDATEPSPPWGAAHTYAWSNADDQIARLATSGVRAVPLFRFTPAWVHEANAAKPRGVDELPPSHYADFAAFVAAFADRYGEGGAFWAERPGLPRLPVRSFEIWNEVNLGEYAWNGVADPEAYAALLKVIRPALKAAQPGGVLLGSLAYHEEEVPDYVARVGRAGGLAALDAMGYHPYAPEARETIALVRHLRAQLVAAGAPAMPIYANEAGQEAVVTNPDGTTTPARPPSEWAWQQFPTDAARAANLAFAGEALAASDCGVDQFLPYSVSDTERDGEKLTEAYMGLFRPTTGAPTLTAEGLFRAAARWEARFAGGGAGVPQRLVLCGSGASDPAAMLPIDTTFSGTAPGCVRVRATYDGNPLEAATLSVVSSAGGNTATQRTNAFGDATACVPSGRADDFRASVQIEGAGIGGSVACDVLAQGCPTGASITVAPRALLSASAVTGLPSATAPAPTPTAKPPACTWSTLTRQVSYTPRRGRRAARVGLAAKLRCTTTPAGARVKFAVSYREVGKSRSYKLGTVTLVNGRERRFTVSGRFRAGKRIVVTYRQTPFAGVPRLDDRLKLSAQRRTSRR